ncbi:LacI family DNA-binding transcriptional regulator, partial [Streptomyces griseoincarnatus]
MVVAGSASVKGAGSEGPPSRGWRTVSLSVPPTSRDVARLAGVSQTTVSYVLTGKGAISPATREHVLKVAESIG